MYKRQGELRRIQSPAAVAVLGPGRQRRIGRNAGDRDRNRVARIEWRLADPQRDFAVLVHQMCIRDSSMVSGTLNTHNISNGE